MLTPTCPGDQLTVAPSGSQMQFIHAVPRNAPSSAERDELVPRNVADLVQIPTPRYKVGKGVQLPEASA